MAGVLAWGGSTVFLIGALLFAYRTRRSSGRQVWQTRLFPLGVLLFWFGMVLSNLHQSAWPVPYVLGATVICVSTPVRQPTPSPADDGTR